MSNQTPAEALRQQLIDDLWARALDMTSDDFKDDDDYLKAQSNYKKLCLKQFTAYAATVEREGRIDEVEKVKLVTYREEIVRYANKRLAALQGPIRGDAPDQSEAAKS